MHARSIIGGGIALLALLIAGLHYIANQYYLYWAYWWADIPMHFLGGLFIGSAALWFLRYEVPIGIRGKFPRLPLALIAVTGVGVLWEVFEYVTGAHAAFNYPLDTLLDLLTNIAGALCAYLLIKKYAH